MSETKIELQQRKIRNGIRKHKESQQKKIWEKLSSTNEQPAPFGDIKMRVTKQRVTAQARKIKAKWIWDPDEILPIRGEKLNE